MENQEFEKQLIVKTQFYENFEKVLEYTIATFGEKVAGNFYDTAMKKINKLSSQYGIYPLNRFVLSTNLKTFRNILINKYYIVYVVKKDCVVVLDIIYQGRNPISIKSDIKFAEKSK